MDKSIPQSHQLAVCVQKRHRLEPIASTCHPRAADGRSLPRVSRDREPESLSNLLREGDVGSHRDALRHKRQPFTCSCAPPIRRLVVFRGCRSLVVYMNIGSFHHAHGRDVPVHLDHADCPTRLEHHVGAARCRRGEVGGFANSGSSSSVRFSGRGCELSTAGLAARSSSAVHLRAHILVLLRHPASPAATAANGCRLGAEQRR